MEAPEHIATAKAAVDAPKNGRARNTAKMPPTPGRREFREFKFVVQAVLLITENGKTVGEQPADQVALYGLQAVRDYADKFPAELEALNTAPLA